MTLSAYVDGLGLLGPGLPNWPDGAEMLSGRREYHPAATVLPVPASLPPAERRRSGRVVRLALSVAAEAVRQAGASPADLASVFSSSGGDGDNCHEICRGLAQMPSEISPTRFANSVHNAAAGYWSIGTGAMAESNVLCAFDASFGAGLLDGMSQVAADRVPVLLVAYDTEYPEPLRSKRPISDAFGIALVLRPEQTEASLLRLTAALTEEDFVRMPPPFEALRTSIPAARALPLLSLLAGGRSGRTVLEYLDVSRIAVQVDFMTR